MREGKTAGRGRSLLELHPSQLLAALFVTFIGVGTILLKLPVATHDGITLIDALFTATSAACVTGLMVVDVGTTFTLFGQIVILALIQIGGLGIMTFGVFFTLLLGRALSLRESSMVFDAFDASHQLSVTELLAKVIQLTLAIEAIGGTILFLRWIPDFGAEKAAYHALFHAVSAFCNAGISLFPDNLVSFVDDPVVNGVIGALIVCGSLGFITIVELYYYGLGKRIGRRRLLRLSLQSRVVLAYTLLIGLVGALLTFAIERDNVLAGMPFDRQVMAALFQSITRTAGFVTVDFHSFTNGTLFVFILLMFIGAAPGSVGGGIKVTTFGVLMAMAAARYQAREVPSLFNRTVPREVIDRSVAILFISSLIVVGFTLALMIAESGAATAPNHREMFMQIMFEVVSAFGTVGLSAGATDDLTPVGKALITLLMLIGRLGPLTVTFAVGKKAPRGEYRYAEESMMVG
jgi:trk system potassium uptake protein TrkH